MTDTNTMRERLDIAADKAVRISKSTEERADANAVIRLFKMHLRSQGLVIVPREPTEAMVWAMRRAPIPGEEARGRRWLDHKRNMWRAAIDAAGGEDG